MNNDHRQAYLKNRAQPQPLPLYTRYQYRALTRSLLRFTLAGSLLLAAGLVTDSDANAQSFGYQHSNPRSSTSFQYDTGERFIRQPTPLGDSNIQIQVAPSTQPWSGGYIPSPSPSPYSGSSSTPIPGGYGGYGRGDPRPYPYLDY